MNIDGGTGIPEENNPDSTDTIINELGVAARQLQASVSSFLQQSETSQDSLITLLQQISSELQTEKTRVEQISRRVERLTGTLANYRQ